VRWKLPTSTPKQPEQCRMSQSIAQQKSTGASIQPTRLINPHTRLINPPACIIFGKHCFTVCLRCVMMQVAAAVGVWLLRQVVYIPGDSFASQWVPRTVSWWSHCRTCWKCKETDGNFYETKWREPDNGKLRFKRSDGRNTASHL